ncbi:zinc-dependent alcohol dehydrogenase family protein [Mucilaginibacter jinjuensis]|uniref:NAD(P)-dependent alcohol dehydrogenase n=1 Tax=Mucilaginibacter jinjuensis TaxID=1176721 RepID=A0ABY7TAY3_9SPHI|nr:NAD(P)-dependent alcohol dehydrogenase [Mucilaginibacter jinjuensis]WCT13363.1 NAD(P)-dependent alcohol dehydrogenase [Mucilaginibacter jinjuensis]
MENQIMKAWRLHDFGLEYLTADALPVPVPGNNEILIRVSAASLNFRDNALLQGYYDPNILNKGPLILASDAVGKVVRAGSGVTRFKAGDRVISHYLSQWLDGVPRPNENEFTYGGPFPGGLAEYMILNENSAVACPESLSDEEAATLPIAGLTAWSAIVNAGQIGQGDSVVIQGTGGVALFAIQFARALGATVIVTTGTDVNGEKAIGLGASHFINYHQEPNWSEAVLELTGGVGVDEVLEMAGGDLNQSVAVLKATGIIAMIGFLDNPELKVNIFPILYKQIRTQGIAVGHRRSFEAMVAFIQQHQIRPVIDKVYDFNDVPAAFRQLAAGAFGKIVIKINP